MTEQKNSVATADRRFTFLSIIGALIFIFGIAEFEVRGMPLRGSGIGTLAIIVGVVIVAWDYVRKKYARKPRSHKLIPRFRF